MTIHAAEPRPFNEDECLSCDPFDGDFGSPDDTVFQDRIVTARKDHECSLCGLIAKAKTRTRVIYAKFDGSFCQYRYCTDCCLAMAKSERDDGRAYEKRIAIREKECQP